MRPRQALAVAAAIALVSPAPAFARSALENPANGGIEAGISAITGWHCTSKRIEIRIDGLSLGYAGSGTPRADTAERCGRSDTGFSLLYNYALLPAGIHHIDAYADGELFASAAFDTVRLGAEFLRGLEGSHEVADFPVRGQKTRVAWSQAKQNFVTTGVGPALSGAIPGVYSLVHFSVVAAGDAATALASSMQPSVDMSGTVIFNADGTYSMSMTLAADGTSREYTGTGTYADMDFYMIADDARYAIIERGETLAIQSAGTDSLVGAATTNSIVIVMRRTAVKAEVAPNPYSIALTPGKAWPEFARALLAATAGR
ncbi:MAG TPA: hypothetical protein VFP36_00790 [Usitatibacter sp.]|nr:hypothetical protein [Usitatibacter sp.]